MRKPSCICGECPKCRNRMSSAAWYKRNKDRVLAKQRERRASGELAAYERDRYHGNEQFRMRKKARNMVSIRLRRKTLERQCCETCGADAAEAHHRDYAKPLDVQWLCKEHHYEAHMEGRGCA